MTIHRGLQLDRDTWQEVCDHEGTTEYQNGIYRCHECECSWTPQAFDAATPFVRVVRGEHNQDSEPKEST